MDNVKEEDEITLEELIDIFVEDDVEENGSSKMKSDTRLKEGVKKHIYEQVKKQIVEKEIENIKEEAHNQQKEEERNENFRKMKVLIFETLSVGLVVGLLVNQATELIANWKGIKNIELYTWFWIFGLIIVLMVLVVGMYLNKIDEFINRKK